MTLGIILPRLSAYESYFEILHIGRQGRLGCLRQLLTLCAALQYDQLVYFGTVLLIVLCINCGYWLETMLFMPIELFQAFYPFWF